MSAPARREWSETTLISASPGDDAEAPNLAPEAAAVLRDEEEEEGDDGWGGKDESANPNFAGVELVSFSSKRVKSMLMPTEVKI